MFVYVEMAEFAGVRGTEDKVIRFSGVRRLLFQLRGSQQHCCVLCGEGISKWIINNLQLWRAPLEMLPHWLKWSLCFAISFN